MPRSSSRRLALCAACLTLTLSGCLALSFGGKTEYVKSECESGLEARVSSLEMRVQSLEQQLSAAGISPSTVPVPSSSEPIKLSPP